MLRTTFAPTRCPASLARPRATAHRPFPSMIIPTCSPGGAPAALCLIKCTDVKKRSSGISYCLDQRFHVVEVPLQRAPARRRQAEVGTRDPAIEALPALDVSRLLELAGVNAQVAVGGTEHRLELVEAEALVDGEHADDAEPHPLVDQAIEVDGATFGGSPRLAAQRPLGTGAARAGLSESPFFSHHASRR